jgi:hypothetical protein
MRSRKLNLNILGPAVKYASTSSTDLCSFRITAHKPAALAHLHVSVCDSLRFDAIPYFSQSTQHLNFLKFRLTPGSSADGHPQLDPSLQTKQ